MGYRHATILVTLVVFVLGNGSVSAQSKAPGEIGDTINTGDWAIRVEETEYTRRNLRFTLNLSAERLEQNSGPLTRDEISFGLDVGNDKLLTFDESCSSGPFDKGKKQSPSIAKGGMVKFDLCFNLKGADLGRGRLPN